MSSQGTPDSGISTTLLWRNIAGDRYFLWDPEVAALALSDSDHVELIAFDGRRATAPSRLLGSRELAPDVVLETLAEPLGQALADAAKALGHLDPALAPLGSRDALTALLGPDTPEIDLPALIERLVATATRNPAALVAVVTELEAPLQVLIRIATFGELARNLVARFGIAPDGGPPARANHGKGPEDPAALRARVAREVRAELDARAAVRPPVADSFRFEDLIKPRS